MTTRVVTIHDRCETPGCGRWLTLLREAERGRCDVCWKASIRRIGQLSEEASRELVEAIVLRLDAMASEYDCDGCGLPTRPGKEFEAMLDAVTDILLAAVPAICIGGPAKVPPQPFEDAAEGR